MQNELQNLLLAKEREELAKGKSPGEFFQALLKEGIRVKNKEVVFIVKEGIRNFNYQVIYIIPGFCLMYIHSGDMEKFVADTKDDSLEIRIKVHYYQ
jgi:hypothetical protein